MRVNLHEMDVVKNAAGATNIMSLFNMMAPAKVRRRPDVRAPQRL